jgi:hypothetical protein
MTVRPYGQYYKTIYYDRMLSKLLALASDVNDATVSLTDVARVVIYDRNVFIMHATGSGSHH